MIQFDRQHTISGPAMCAGPGVHLGQVARVRVMPAPAGHGVVFARLDHEAAETGENRIAAHVGHVASARLGTTLRNAAGVEIATVEHFLAACAGLGLDNLLVEVDGPELPILDGSSAPFVRMLQNAGLRAQPAFRRHIQVLERVEVRRGAKVAALEPADASWFDVTIRYEDGPIGVQRRTLLLTRERFLSEISEARTYGFMSEVGQLHAMGRGLGASLENTVVIDEGRVVNAGGLRFEDEFVRHKILDAIGDLALVGAPVLGRYVADQPGHELNLALARALLEAPQSWRWTEAAELAAAV